MPDKMRIGFWDCFFALLVKLAVHKVKLWLQFGYPFCPSLASIASQSGANLKVSSFLQFVLEYCRGQQLKNFTAEGNINSMMVVVEVRWERITGLDHNFGGHC